MGFDAVIAIAVVLLVLVLLATSRFPADIVLLGALTVLLVSGVLSEAEALAGFANEGMVTIAVLFVVGAGVVETGVVTWIAERLFGRPKSVFGAIRRVILPTASLSAVMNNTPLVAMLIPAVNDWAKHHRIAASKLMIPLSYAAILGGTCTLIGTSTNLVVNGMLLQAWHAGGGRYAGISIPNGLGFFDITWVGLPAAVIGLGFLVLTAAWLLPERVSPIRAVTDPREYTVEMLVEPGSPLVGKSIEQAGLRHLPGVYLAEIDRDGVVLPAVGPEEVLRANDRLVFVGVVDSVVELQKIRGLVPATDQVFKLDSPRSQRCLIEAVASDSCPVVGRTIRDGRFRSIYNAVVIAVARHGERIRGKIGDIVLRAGDTLLLEAHPSFVARHRNSRHFFLVSRLENSTPPRHERALVALAILIGMVVLAAVGENLGPLPGIGQITMLKAALVAAGLMLATRCCGVVEARRAIDWPVLLAIGASFGIGQALVKTGAAEILTHGIAHAVGGNPWLSLAAIYGVTLLVTEVVTNNAAAALMFPFALATAAQLHANPMPFVIAVMMAASAGFATPIGYQTNLMVYGPGGYRFSDYLKIGVPMDLLIMAVTVVLAPLVWPFYPAP